MPPSATTSTVKKPVAPLATFDFEKTAFYLRVRRAKLVKNRDRLLGRLPD